jgi:probable phosphoglycerate mutase
MTKFYFIRHGEIQRNIEGALPGYTDSLTDKGRDQAKESAIVLKNLLESPAHLFYSPMDRAAETANIILQQLSDTNLIISSQVDSRIQEASFGALEGKTWSQVDEIIPGQSQAYIDQVYDFTEFGGDDYSKMKDRVYDFINEMKRIYPEQSVVVVTHGGVIRCVYKVEKNQVFEKVPSNASVHTFDI